MLTKVRVLIDARRHLRMGKLHEQRSAAPEKKHVLAIDPAGDRILAVKAGLHRPIKPL